MSTNDGRTPGDEAPIIHIDTTTVSDWRRLAELLDVMSQPTTRTSTPLPFDPDDYPPDDDTAIDDEARRLARYRLEIAPDDWRRFHTAKDSTP